MISLRHSSNLSKKLERVLGSETVIKTRQQVFAEANISIIKIPREMRGEQLVSYINSRPMGVTQHIVTGSKSEGFALPGTDLDVMVVNKSVTVYETQAPTDVECVRPLYDARYTG